MSEHAKLAEKPRFVIGISVLSVMFIEIDLCISSFGGNMTISGC